MKTMRSILSLVLAVLLLCGSLSIAAFAENESNLTIAELGGYARVIACNQLAAGAVDVPAVYNGLPVTEIGAKAFKDCVGVTKITLPASVTTVGTSAFENCYALRGVVFEGETCTLGAAAFRGCSALIQVALPEKLTAIPTEAFANCAALAQVELPATLTTIGAEAFSNCKSLVAVRIPSKVTVIGESAFLSCLSVASYAVAVGNTAYRAISGCLYTADGKTLVQYPCGNSAASFSVPAGTETIANGAFRGCTALESVTLPASVKSVEDYAFSHCSALRSVSMQNGVEHLGSLSFGYCEALTAITLPGSLTDYASAFYHSGLQRVTIQNGVAVISDRAFQECASLRSVQIPASVTAIEIGAFDGCEALTTLTVPATVETIGRRAFNKCSQLTLAVVENSAAHLYAQENDIPYRLTDGSGAEDHGAVLGIQITALPDKTDYRYKSTLDTAGLALLVAYEDGTTETVTSGFTCDPTYLSKRGTQTITVTYEEQTAQFNVRVTFSLLQMIIYYLLLGFLWGY